MQNMTSTLFKGTTYLIVSFQIKLKTTRLCDTFPGLCQWPALGDWLQALENVSGVAVSEVCSAPQLGSACY